MSSTRMTGEVWRGAVSHDGEVVQALLALGVDPHPFTLTEDGLWQPMRGEERRSPLAVAIYRAAMADPEAAQEILLWDSRWTAVRPDQPFPEELFRPADGIQREREQTRRSR